MKNLILVDGNNLLFRSYYATAYTGNFMKNSKNFPTNALFGFANMINKIISEEKPTHIIVAFDKGKTFRHEKYQEYKAGRIQMPDELKQQFPVAKEMLTNMGITYYEIENYEADDIIGTFAQFCEEDENFTGTIISSDKDLLQLISPTVDIKLLKTKDYIRYNQQTFFEEYKINPINIIDLKSLMGDPSDNIKGVKGIGEKTALKLLEQYKNLDGIYENINSLSPKIKEKLEQDKESAYLSHELATIYKKVPIDIKISDLEYKGPNEKLNQMYEELEFYSFLKQIPKKQQTTLKYKIITNIEEINITDESAIYLETTEKNYHKAEILGMAVYNKNNAIYIPKEKLKENPKFLTTINKITYDLKKTYVALKKENIKIDHITFDTMLAAYLLEYNVKDDIAYLANQYNYNIPFYETQTNDNIIENTIKKAQFIYETYEEILEKLKKENMYQLFKEMELPLTFVLGDMEYYGINVDKIMLENMGNEIKEKISEISTEIYNLAGKTFNISSTQQLGEILFENLNLPHGKKGKTGYSTAVDVLNKLKGKHPIIEKILEYRSLTKLYTTYIEGLVKEIKDDNKIHTIYNQALTRTGRLSSQEPNLQNIPARDEYGKLIRKAFIPSEDSIIISGDYSQIELRIMASIAKVDTLIEAFKNNIDIHKKTASDIFKKPLELVTDKERRIAKAVNFGIIYGISSFGLSENLKITPKEAQAFIDEYMKTYPGIKEYMENTIKEAHDKGYVKTLMGRIRTIQELQNKNYMIRQSGERMALNTPIQGTSADIIKIAMIQVSEQLKEKNLKSKMILQIHDELVIDTKKNEQEEVIKIIEKSMENAYNLLVPLKVEINIGNNLYEAK